MVQTYVDRSRYCLVGLVFFLMLVNPMYAQWEDAERCWVFYKDKHATTFDPHAYFDAKAIARRQREGLALADSTDFPVNQQYINAVQPHATAYVAESRWFNASVCYLTPSAQRAVAQLPFVQEVRTMQLLPLAACVKSVLGYDLDLMRAQTDILGYKLFADRGLNGKGVNIAIFDAGFKGVPTHPQLQHLVDNNQIKATYNIVLNRNFVFDYHTHGTMVLSCMAGIYNDTPMGCAPGANYLLSRTEQTSSDSKIEEDHWVRSLEWADKNGADIVNSSLGYNVQLYTRKDMTGSSHMMAKAANTAFSKGILVVNSAGNNGQDWWEIVSAPGDADSVLTVGGIDPWSGAHHPMSSYGPNTAGQLKPNVSAFFKAVVCSANGLTEAEGTSFSSPLVAGFAACVMQMHPDWTVRKVYTEIQKSAHLYPYYDYAHGYGIPQAAYFIDPALPVDSANGGPSAPLDSTQHRGHTFDFVYNATSDTYRIQLCEELLPTQAFVAQPADSVRSLVYYHLCDENGNLLTYHVILPEEFDGAVLETTNCDECMIRAHYAGQTLTTTRKKIREATFKKDEKN
jgi:serine protease AprX